MLRTARLLRAPTPLCTTALPLRLAPRALLSGGSHGGGPAKLRAHVRPEESDDKTVLRSSDITSRAEKEAPGNFFRQLSIGQRIRMSNVMVKLVIRQSFMHGGISTALTVMAVYAAGCEVLHDFFHHHHIVHGLLDTMGTKHAVGLIALSHLAHHYKEYLEDQGKPKYHTAELLRDDLLAILKAESCPTMPPHIVKAREYFGGTTTNQRTFDDWLSEAEKKAGEKDTDQ